MKMSVFIIMPIKNLTKSFIKYSLTIIGLATLISGLTSSVTAQYTSMDMTPYGQYYTARGVAAFHAPHGFHPYYGGSASLKWGSYERHALIWVTYSPDYYNDLHPGDYDVNFLITGSYVTGLDAYQQVGAGYGYEYSPGSIFTHHALLWSGSAESVVSLHPPTGFRSSEAYGVSNGWQIGTGVDKQTRRKHALLWNGTAESVVDLTPYGFVASEGWGIDGEQQVGMGRTSDPFWHALLWYGTAESAVDLHPPQFSNSYCFATSNDKQVGFGRIGYGHRHALLWAGSSDSVQDLHPAGFSDSYAHGLYENRQFGMGQPIGSDHVHAIVWFSTAESAIDLHQFLPSDFSYVSSEARGGDVYGNIIGVAQDEQGIEHAILWRRDPRFSPPVFHPTHLVGKVCSQTRMVTLKWRDNADNEEGFYIERAQVDPSHPDIYERVGEVVPNAIHYSEIVDNGIYRYRVQAFNQTTGQVSNYSPTKKIRVK